MSESTADEIRQLVRDRYASIARKSQSCCGNTIPTGTDPAEIGYSNDALSGLDDVARTSLGCGNPLGLDAIRPGDKVLDLESGTGLDCFLAARATGANGYVIGVDMTPEMIETAKRNVLKFEMNNVEFRLGQIESLPVEDQSIDLAISNCVINLSPDKERVFQEVFRVLRPNGRLVFTDRVATAPIAPELKEDKNAFAACVSGAAQTDTIRWMLAQAGFSEIGVSTVNPNWTQATGCCGEEPQVPVVSALIKAVKLDSVS